MRSNAHLDWGHARGNWGKEVKKYICDHTLWPIKYWEKSNETNWPDNQICVCVCVCAPHIYLLGLYYVLSTVLTVLHIWTVFVLPETLKNNNNFIPIFSNVARKIKKSLSILCKVHSSNKQRRQDTKGERVWRGCVLSEIRKIRLEFISLIVGRYLSKEVW